MKTQKSPLSHTTSLIIFEKPLSTIELCPLPSKDKILGDVESVKLNFRKQIQFQQRDSSSNFNQKNFKMFRYRKYSF